MYSTLIIENMKEFLSKELEQINKDLDGNLDFGQAYMLGQKNVIEYVLNSIDIGKEDK